MKLRFVRRYDVLAIYDGARLICLITTTSLGFLVLKRDGLSLSALTLAETCRLVRRHIRSHYASCTTH